MLKFTLLILAGSSVFPYAYADAGTSAAGKRRPDIVIIMTDDQAAEPPNGQANGYLVPQTLSP